MKAIKIITVIILVVIGYLFFHLIINNDNAEPVQTQIEINDDYKTKQDDKDSVVDTNKRLLVQLDSLTEKIKRLENNQKVNEIKQTTADRNAKNETSRSDRILSGGKAVVEQVLSTVNQRLPDYDIQQSGDQAEGQAGSEVNGGHYTNAQNSYIWFDALNSVTVTNAFGTVDDNKEGSANITLDNDAKQNSMARFSVPPNSILGGVLTTALLGRIPVNGQVSEPYRFSVQIKDKSLFANHHAHQELTGMLLSGTTTGDLLLSCAKGVVDSVTYIFADGTISQTQNVDIALITDEYGYPCIKGTLITNATTQITLGALFGGLSEAAKARAGAEETINSSDGNTSSDVTGNPETFAAYNALSGGIDSVQKWFSDRVKSSFDVIYVPSGAHVKLLFQNQLNIDYDPNGRKIIHHQIPRLANYEKQLD